MVRLSEAINKDNEFSGNIQAVKYDNVSIIIPVKDNQGGIDRFLHEFFLTHTEDYYPKEIIIIDNNSKNPVKVDDKYCNTGLILRVLDCKTKGPAAARNYGAKASKGDWLLFCDSDCIPTSTLIKGYVDFSKRAIAYTGNVKALENDWLSHFYDTENILLPHLKSNSRNELVPLYIVTANALVWKQALIECGYFNETFNNAGGEDVELAIRLWKFGNICHVTDSLIIHDFDEGVLGFYKRFLRYGKGNMQLENVQNIDMCPKFRKPIKPSFSNYIAKVLQHLFMTYGYFSEKRRWNKPKQ